MVERIREPVWSGTNTETHFIELTSPTNETLDSVLAGIGPWLAKLAPPSGTRLVWGPFEPCLGTSGCGIRDGWRSYLVKGNVFLSSSDVESVTLSQEPNEDWCVSLQLRSESAARIRMITRNMRRQRIALIVNGLVISAPLVFSEIPDSRGVMEVGGFDAGTRRSRAQADRLLQRLTGGH